MAATIGVILDVFTWIGLGAAAVIAVVWGVLAIADGVWLPAEGHVYHEDGTTVVRWIDADNEVNSATATGAMASALVGVHSAPIWYRDGWQGRMRLTRHDPRQRRLAVAWFAMMLLWLVCFGTGLVLTLLGA